MTSSVYDYLEQCVDKKYLLKQKGAHFITRSINYQKSYTQVNGDIALCQKRNQQFNWHGDFIFHPQLRDDSSTPETDETLFNVSDYEEDYYAEKASEKYALDVSDMKSACMVPVNRRAINSRTGRFRKLTPRECLRLMGFDDTFKIVVSDTETYKQSGNSIVVNVLMALLKQIDITKYGTDVQ